MINPRKLLLVKFIKLNKCVNKIDVLLSVTNRNAKSFNRFFTPIFFYVKDASVHRQ